MKTLFISTYNDFLTVGLLSNGELMTKKEDKIERNHSSSLIPSIDEILKVNNLETTDLTEIIVVNGPGSFTGVRLGVTVAKVLAYTLKIGIKVISSVEAIAIADSYLDKKLVALYSCRGYFYATFENNVLLDEIKYLEEKEFDNLIKANPYNELYKVTECELNLEAIAKSLKHIEPLDPRTVNPIYIKLLDGIK